MYVQWYNYTSTYYQLYVVLVLGEVHSLRTCCRDMKVTLGIGGLAICLFSIISAAGFFSYVGVSCSMIIFQILPFLVLAVGVDNIFIFVETLERVEAEQPDLVWYTLN